MRLRPHRRNLVVWSPHGGPAGRYGVPRLARPTRTRRIRRFIRTGALLTVIGMMRLTRHWRPLTGVVLTMVGVMLRSGAGGVVLLPGMMLLVISLLVPASPKSARTRRSELERELGSYSTPAQRRDLEAILDRYPDGITYELRDILASQVTVAGNSRLPGVRQ